MNNFLISFILLLSMTVGAQNNLREEIEKIIYNDTELNLSDHPNILIGIYDNDQRYIVHLSQKSDIDTSSIFEIGSITKPIIAGYIYYLHDTNQLDISQSIKEFIPELGESSIAEMTLDQIINGQVNFSRLPRNMGFFEKTPNQPFKNYNKSNLISFLMQESFKSTKDAHYSHIGYALMQFVIEKTVNQDYTDAVNNYASEILGLESTGYNKEPIEGYRRDGKLSTEQQYATFGTSEGLKSNLNDLLDLIEYHVETETTKNYLQKTMSNPIASNLGKDIYQSNGWVVYRKYAKSDIYTFTGKSKGHSAEICFLPKTKTGVVILSNSSFGTQNLPYLILRMINNQWKRK